MHAKKIGLVTWFLGANYGSVLQAYSLRKVLTDLGHEVYFPMFFEYPFTLKNMKVNLFTRLGIKRKKPLQDCPFPIQKQHFLDFIDKEFPRKLPVTALQMRIMCKNTDLFMAGSDQIWNCYDHFRPFEFLAFAGNCKRTSYASSIGTKDIPPQCQDAVKAYLNNFAGIGVREKTAERVLRELTGRNDIKTVLDPTFLLEAEKWNDFAQKTPLTYSRDGGYLFCYFLRKASEYSKHIAKVKKLTGLKNAIMLPSAYFPQENLEGVERIEDAGPVEFIKALGGASYVLTDSFHGTALSINLGKQFVNLKRFSDSDPASQNSRIADLHDMFSTGDRFFNDVLPDDIDYVAVNSRLAALRQESMDFLLEQIR